MIPLLLALDWYVADPDSAAELQQALDTHWPDAGIEIQVGPVPADAEGVWVHQGTLHWQQGDRSVEQPSPSSPAGQVLLVQSWTQALDPVDQGWVPEPDLPDPLPDRPQPVQIEVPIERPEPAEPETNQVEAEPRAAADKQRMVAGHAGVNLRNGKYNDPFRVGAEIAWTGRIHKAVLVDVDAGARLTETDWYTSRAGADLQLGLARQGANGTGEVWLGAGMRSLQVHSPTAGLQYVAPMPRASMRLRWWGPVRDERLLLGVALALQVEGTYSARAVPTPDHPLGEHWVLDPATALLEFHLGRWT